MEKILNLIIGVLLNIFIEIKTVCEEVCAEVVENKKEEINYVTEGGLIIEQYSGVDNLYYKLLNKSYIRYFNTKLPSTNNTRLVDVKYIQCMRC